MFSALIARSAVLIGVALLAWHSVRAQVQPSPPATTEPSLFAVEITIGPKWDPTKPAQDQHYFREHSSNLKRIRDAGALVMGARYSDKGLLVLAARDESHARSMMEEDPSIRAEVFSYQLHPFSVFYGGTVSPRLRQATQ
jgi:hypothetical protein